MNGALRCQVLEIFELKSDCLIASANLQTQPWAPGVLVVESNGSDPTSLPEI